jgi:hypothetical protein
MKELEYVSALHQTSMPNTRPDGTISSLDVLRYLKSRHSLEISHLQGRDIVQGLGGGFLCEAVKEELVAEQTQRHQAEPMTGKKESTKSFWKRKSREDEIRQEAEEGEMDVQAELLNPTFEYLDLVQTTSILLIPVLAGIAQKWKQKNERVVYSGVSFYSALEEEQGGNSNGPPETYNQGGQEDRVADESSLKNLIRDVLQILLKNSEPIDGPSGKEAPFVTPGLVEGLLFENQEEERAKDSALIQRMVDVAHSPSGRLDEEAFLNALASDLNSYEDGCEVMPLLTKKKITNEASRRDEEEPKTRPAEVTKINTLRVIDSVVDDYASRAVHLLIWLFFLATSVVFVSVLNTSNAFETGCQKNGDQSFVCTLSSTISVWYVKMTDTLLETNSVLCSCSSRTHKPTKFALMKQVDHGPCFHRQWFNR